MIRFFKIAGLGILSCVVAFIILDLISPGFFDRSSNFLFTKIIRVKCINYRQSSFSRKLNDRIVDYSVQAKLSGINECRDENELKKRTREGKLVKVKSGNKFIIDDLSFSYPYVTRESKILLEEIGRRFTEKASEKGIGRPRFFVTSLTRTTAMMKDLRKSNSNASVNSPHLYGNAFDISYIRFSARKWFLTECDKRFLKEALAEVIWQLSVEKKCWATYEVKQSCFHVVAR